MRNRPLSLDEKRRVREFYDGRFPARSNYLARHPFNETIARYRATLVKAVFPDHGKLLDAGCAGGAEVLAFRRECVDAWGFDICPDLLDVAYAEVQPFVRIGRMDHVPYSAADGFRTLVSYDVLEHVPIDCVQRFPDELRRLGIQQVACVIANDTISDGHITVQDTAFWVELFARAGLRLMTELTADLERLHVPVQWLPDQQRVLLAPYQISGKPRNGWNQVPGHLFFTRAKP